MPPVARSCSPVSQTESSAARNTAIGAISRREPTHAGADVDDARAFTQVLDGCLRGENRVKHVDVEKLVKTLFGYCFEWANS
jgi:hypothetical protein